MGETTKVLMNLLAFLVIVLIGLRVLFLRPVIIQDNGMAPTLVYGEEVWMWKGAMAEMADIMVCRHPTRPEQLVIGRVVAFGGHSISTDPMGNLYVDRDRTVSGVDGGALFYDRTRKRQFDMLIGAISYFGKHDHQVFIEKGRSFQLRTYAVSHGIYLLGDNRAESEFDSREFGEVDPRQCLGEVLMRVRPVEESRVLDHGRYELVR